MNTGLVTSFVIGGLLLLSILFMNLNVNRSATQLTMRQISQQNANTISELLNYDIPKIGYQAPSAISDAISTADSNRIAFEGDIDNNGTTETIEWFFDSSVPSSTNPNDHNLFRSNNGTTTEMPGGVIKCKFIFRNEDRTIISTPITSQAQRNEIRYIEVELTVSSREKLGNIRTGDGEYIKSYWHKEFAPKNLN